ncbi:kinase-like domain-containing protein [Cyathus striatus]|nr:kinase-like domain-containing protein [Cyathus striatus]
MSFGDGLSTRQKAALVSHGTRQYARNQQGYELPESTGPFATNVSIDIQRSTADSNLHPPQTALHCLCSCSSLPTAMPDNVGPKVDPTPRFPFSSSSKPPVVQLSPVTPRVGLNDNVTAVHQPASVAYSTIQRLQQLREISFSFSASVLFILYEKGYIALSRFFSSVMDYHRLAKAPTRTSGIHIHPTTIISLLQCVLCCLTLLVLAFLAVLAGGYYTRKSSIAPTNENEDNLLSPAKRYKVEAVRANEDGSGLSMIFLKLIIDLHDYVGDEQFIPPIVRTGLYVPQKKLGGGSCGIVHLYKLYNGHNDLPTEVAVKWMIETKDNLREARLTVMDQEISIATVVSGLPGMTMFFAGEIGGEKSCSVMEYYKNGSFGEVIEMMPSTFSRHEIYTYLAEMVLAVHRLHQHGLVHCDIKPENIFIGPDNHIRLGDYGFTHMFETPDEELLSKPEWSDWADAYRKNLECLERLGSSCTPGFAAPEVLHGEDCSVGIDFYSIGVIAHLFLTMEYPFDDPHAGQPGQSDELKERVLEFSPLLRPEELDFITGMLQPNPEDRLGYKEILNHEMFREIDWDAIESGSAVGVSGDWLTEMEKRKQKYEQANA